MSVEYICEKFFIKTKKTIAIVYRYTLLCLFALVIVSTYANFFVYSILIASHKKSYQALISNPKNGVSIYKCAIKISDLYINSPNIIWLDDNKEIIINSNLYDIVVIDTFNGNAVLSLVSDDQEERINGIVADFFGLNKAENKSNAIKLLKELMALEYIGNFNAIPYYKANCSLIGTKLSFSILNPYITQQTPPP